MKLSHICFITLFPLLTHAQRIHSKIPIKEFTNVSSELHLTGLELNDSLFIAAPSKKKGLTRAFWILPSGETVRIISPELKNKSFVSLATRGSDTFFYYLEELPNNGFYLRSIIQNRNTALVTADKTFLPVPGNFVSVFPYNKTHYLLSVLENKNEIHLITLEGMQKIKETVITSPFTLNTDFSPFVFISDDAMVTPLLAASPNKFYLRDGLLYLTMDRRTEDGKSAQTSLLKFNLETGESETGIIIETSDKDFSTYICGGLLFKITKSRSSGAFISIHSLDDYKACQTLLVEESTSFAQNRSFKRDLAKTTDKESVWDAVSNNAVGFIIATATDSTNFTIRVGTYHLISRSAAQFIPVVSSNPFLVMAGNIARDIVYSFSESESVDHYFYLKWNHEMGPAFADQPMDIMHVIDHYDIASYKEKKKFDYKAYLKGDSKIFGIYHESGNPFVHVLLFEGPY